MAKKVFPSVAIGLNIECYPCLPVPTLVNLIDGVNSRGREEIKLISSGVSCLHIPNKTKCLVVYL